MLLGTVGAAGAASAASRDAIAQEPSTVPPHKDSHAVGGSDALSPTDIGAAPVVNIRSAPYGAVGDGTTDDGPALQAALDAIASAGGGELVIPKGRFKISSAITKNFRNQASAIRIKGLGSASQLLIATGSSADALILENLEHLVIEGVTFVGTPATATDARITLKLTGVKIATMRDCNWYGVSSTVSGGDVVYASDSDLHIDGCGFRGCGGNSGTGPAVVHAHKWNGLRVENSDFIDYGTLNGVFHSKTPIAPPYAWIYATDSAAVASSSNQSEIVLRRLRLDEGAQQGVLVSPSSGYIEDVHMSSVNINGGKTGIWLRRVRRALIERTWIGYDTVGPKDAVKLVDVDYAALNGVRCEQGMNRITANSHCKELVIRNCVYTTLNSSAARTSVEASLLGLSDGVTWDPPSVTDGGTASTTVTVKGATVGDPVSVGFSQPVPAGALLVASVTATNTVTVTLFNKTGGSLDLPSGKLRADVWRR